MSLSGELRCWHKVTLTVDGPEASENGSPNPFMDYRMQVTFEHADSGLSYSIPGYYAADGDAANSSASSGNKWRAHLAPDYEGQWNYAISFRQGSAVAVDEDSLAGEPVAGVDGLRGTFTIAASDKTGRDLRGKGRLKYVGKHHLQFAGTGEFFLKAGADAPENFLAYQDFDGDFKSDGIKDNLIKDWQPHLRDWREGDPTWGAGKGKAIIGAVNYLADQGLNAFSFLTLNIDGDDRNVFPYTDYAERFRMDCSRLDQWEILFEQATRRGMYLHFKTQEAENVNLLDKGGSGPQRKLYYRELVARFSHHLALNWNLGEEVGLGNKVSTAQKQGWANCLSGLDPYGHHMVIHNGNDHLDLLGDASPLTGFSLQTNRSDFRNVHSATLRYLRASAKVGRPWVVACDEPGDAQHSLVTDAEDPGHDLARRNALWGNLMAGGAGVEWYFGYAHPHSDLTCQDYRVRANMWKQSRLALEFFRDHPIPFWTMSSQDRLLDNPQAYCLADPHRLYLVYLKDDARTHLDLKGVEGVFEILWFNPRTGGELQLGTCQAVRGGQLAMLGQPPSERDQDWLAVVRPGDPDRNYPPGVHAGANQTVMVSRDGVAKVELSGMVVDSRRSTSDQTLRWSKQTGPGSVRFAEVDSAETSATLEQVGTYVLSLRANDGGQTAESTVTVRVQPFETRVTQTIQAVDDLYFENGRRQRNSDLKVEGERRVALIKFELPEVPKQVLTTELRLTVSGDAGEGQLSVYLAEHSDWDSQSLHSQSKPNRGKSVGSGGVQAVVGKPVSVTLENAIVKKGLLSVYVVLSEDGNDIWFGSTRSGHPPQLVVTSEGDE